MSLIPGAILGTAAISGAAGLGQGISGLFKTRLEKEQEEDLEDLIRREEGGGLGLSPEERRQRERQLLGPVRAAATAAQSRNEALLASRQGLSGADLARVRGETQRAVGEGTIAAQERILSEDVQRESAEMAEIRQIQATLQARRDARRQQFLGGLGQAAGAAGQILGASPEFFRAADVAGAPIADPNALDVELGRLADAGEISQKTADILRRIPNRQKTAVVNASVNGNTSDPLFNQELFEALTEDAATRQLGPAGVPPVGQGITSADLDDILGAP